MNGLVFGHRRLNLINREVHLLAVVFVPLPPQAVEVGVSSAVPVGRRGNAEPTAAAGTKQRAFQVVWPLLALILVQVTGIQNGLHRLKGGVVYQTLMFAGVLHAVVGDNPFVVRVVQNTVHGLWYRRNDRPTVAMQRSEQPGLALERRQPAIP